MSSIDIYEEEKRKDKDHIATPRWVVEEIYKIIDIEKYKSIWFPFNHYDSEFKLKADELKLKYKATHKFDDLGNDFFITDPPYNINVSNSQGMTIKNDNMSNIQFYEFLKAAFNNANENLKEGGAFYIWHADNESLNFRQASEYVGWKIRQCLIWVKNGFTLGRQDYQWKHEPCLYGWKDGEAHYFVNDRTQSTVIEDKLDVNKLKKEEMKDLIKELLKEKEEAATTVIYEDKPLINTVHPTMKPIKLIAKLISNSSRKNEIVLDIFGGSGSTLIACEQLNRQCYTMELDPKYCDVIIKRWEELTGNTAVKI